jgi:hypothetical protein
MEKKVRANKERKNKEKEIYDVPSKFPPDPPSNALLESIIKGFCNDAAPQNFVEGGYVVCGILSSVNNMILLNEMNCDDLNMISPGDIGHCERLHESDPIISLDGPILAENCNHVCQDMSRLFKKE